MAFMADIKVGYDKLGCGYLKIFGEMPKDYPGKNVYMTESERKQLEHRWEWQKRKNLKRKLLGFCGTKAVKSLEGIARILIELGACNSINEGVEKIRHLYGKRINYHSGIFGGNGLTFFKDTDSDGKEAVNVSTYILCPSPDMLG